MATQFIRSLDQAAVQAITHFNGHWGSAAYTLFQTAVVHKETTDPKFSQHALKIQAVFNLIDIGSVLWGIKTVATELNNKYQIRATGWTGRQLILASSGSLAAVTLFFFATLFAITRLEKYFNPHKEPNDLLKELPGVDYEKISIRFDLPPSQLLAQQLYAARIILNVALACLSNYRTLSLLSLVAQIYSSYKLFQFKWLNLSRTMQVHRSFIDQVKVSYHCLLTPASHQYEAKECGALCGGDEQPESYFCSNHTFHDACIASMIYGKSDQFLNIQSIVRTETRDQYGTSYSYKAQLKEASLPKCPQACSELYPFHGYFEINVHDCETKENYDVSVTITDSMFTPMDALPQFMQGLNLVYNTFQAALATLQQLHPEIASQILFAQRVMLLTDSIAIARDSLQLYWKHKKELSQKDAKPLQQKVRAAALSILGALGILWISLKMKPSCDLKKCLPLAPAQLKNVNVFWGTPRIHQLSQLILTLRIALNLFSAFTAEKQQRTLHIFAASLQSLTLYKISQLPWLKFERTFKNPDGSIWAQKSGEQNSIKELTIGSHILLQEPVSSTTISPTLKSLYDYFTNFFNGSHNWSVYWGGANKGNGVELFLTLNYDVKVIPSTLQASLAPYVNRVTASAVHRSQGSAVVNLK